MEHNKMFKYDPHLGWKFLPGKKGFIIYPGEVRHYIETNSMGFRDGPPAPDQDKMKRIMVVGDSFVSNISVKLNEVFTEVLEQRLKNTAVLNFGVNGYGQVQEYLLLREWLPRINPHLVVVVIYIRNDFDDNVGHHWLYSRPYASWSKEGSTLELRPPLPQKPDSEPFWRVYRELHIFNFLNAKIELLVAKFSHPVSVPPELYLCQAQLSEETALMYRTTEELLLKIARYADERGVPLVFAIAPSIVQVEDEVWSSVLLKYGRKQDDYIRTLPNDRLMRFAENNNLPMVDLLPLLRLETKKGKNLYFHGEQHWTREGNRVVADALLRYLETRSLIGGGDVK